MATAKFGMFITALKGKIGGTVAQGSKVGTIIKNKPNWKPSRFISRPEIPGSVDPVFV
jgi:hypothetical protein